MWIILYVSCSNSFYKCFILHRSVNNEPKVCKWHMLLIGMGFRYSPPFPSSQATSDTHRWGTYTFTALERSTQRTSDGRNNNIEHATCLTHTFLRYARATDHSSSTGILQVHWHSRRSNTKYFASYMLFLEEQLEARATVWLFAYLIGSSLIQQILD